METPQQRMKAKLESCGIPAKRVDVYGSQIMITAWSRGAAEKWASLLSRFAKVSRVIESMDYAKENKNTVLLPSAVKVWRVGATI